MRQRQKGGDPLPKLLIYIVLIAFAISIAVPVSWAFFASIKQNSEFYGNPWAFPKGFYYQNFIDAFEKANMGSYMLNSAIVTAMALLILLVVALPAAYVLARTRFWGRRLLQTAFMGGAVYKCKLHCSPHFPYAYKRRPLVKGGDRHYLFS